MMKVDFAYYLFLSLDGATCIVIQVTWRNNPAMYLKRGTYKLLGLDSYKFHMEIPKERAITLQWSPLFGDLHFHPPK